MKCQRSPHPNPQGARAVSVAHYSSQASYFWVCCLLHVFVVFDEGERAYYFFSSQCRATDKLWGNNFARAMSCEYKQVNEGKRRLRRGWRNLLPGLFE